MSDRAEEMRRLWDEGLSFRQIGEHFGVSGQRAHQILGNLGRRTNAKHRAIRATRLAAYERIVAKETTLDDEAEKLGLTPSRLREYLRQAFALRIPTVKPEHGMWSRYTHYKCRCRKCKAVARAQYLNRVARGPEEHGTASAYHNFGCRCDPCRAAGAEENRRARDRRKRRERAATRMRAEV